MTRRLFVVVLLLVMGGSLHAAKATKQIDLEEEKPTGAQAIEYAEYRQMLLAMPQTIELLHKNKLQILDLWTANEKVPLFSYPHLIWISRKFQRVVYFESGIPTRIYPTSTGKSGDRYGVYVIDYKQEMHISNLPDCQGTPMPWALHFDKGRFLHQSKLTRCIGIRPDSHGCGRLFGDDAKELYGLITTGVHIAFTP